MFDRAYSKINLSLDINGVREDGYHTLDSIFLPLDFYDEVFITKNETMIFECNRSYIRYDENNTIYKAINLMKEEFNIKDNFKIVLNKHIPTQAGLGGGSADGAAVIRIINKMYNLNLQEEKIKDLCLKIGADVLFTYYNKPAHVSGIGDEVKFIDVKDDYYILLIKPKYGVSTKECYRIINLDNCCHPDINKLEEALRDGKDYLPYLGNSMEEAATSLLKDVGNAKKSLLDEGAPFALMSGSGSTVFTMSKDENVIRRLYEALNGKGYFLRHTKVLKK